MFFESLFWRNNVYRKERPSLKWPIFFLIFLQNGKSPGSIVVNIASPKPDDGEREEGEIKDGDESIQILERFVVISNSYD